MRKKMEDGSCKYFIRVEKQLIEVSEAVHKAYYFLWRHRKQRNSGGQGFCRACCVAGSLAS